MVTIKLKMGKKGYVIIPKIIREKYGFKEDGYILAELREDGVLLKPVPSIDDLRGYFKKHAEKLRSLKITSPKLGELKGACLEEEFQ